MTHPANHSQPHPGAHFEARLRDEAATLRLGAQLAGCVGPGTRIYLRGDLGSGKTTLVRGLLRRLGFRGRVKSPTYTLVELYVLSRLNFYHFDFYRFRDPREWDETGFRDYFNEASACVVEWPERAGDALPDPDIEIRLAHAASGREARIRAFTPAGDQCLTRLADG